MYEFLVEYRCLILRIMDFFSGFFLWVYVNEEICRFVSDFFKLGICRGGILVRNRFRIIRVLWYLFNLVFSYGRYLKLDMVFKMMDKESGRVLLFIFFVIGFI